ncbi:MAG: NAD+ synthase [candidate division Zixibacteria bacterium]|nr:NAD+ synthase [candidate division Zixibacteria bacterium]
MYFSDINPANVVERLIEFFKNELEETGLQKFIVGLSGGLDSSVCAVLAVKAVGAESVLGVMMPYKNSSSNSLKDAEELAGMLGIETKTVDISPMSEAYFNIAPDINDLRQGNFMARIRMAILYDFAAKNKGLVLGTSNKTEALLGYGTLHGDVAWDIDPLWDLYKTQVRQVAEYLEIPRKILDKTPSADLWEGQTDEAELGFTYERIDELLYLMVDYGYDFDHLLDEGFEKDEIQRARSLVKGNQFKRLGPKVARLFHDYPGCDFIAPEEW